MTNIEATTVGRLAHLFGERSRRSDRSSPSPHLEREARRCAWGSISVTDPPIAAAVMTQRSPIGPPPITATSSLASIPPAATAAL